MTKHLIAPCRSSVSSSYSCNRSSCDDGFPAEDAIFPSACTSHLRLADLTPLGTEAPTNVRLLNGGGGKREQNEQAAGQGRERRRGSSPARPLSVSRAVPRGAHAVSRQHRLPSHVGIAARYLEGSVGRRATFGGGRIRRFVRLTGGGKQIRTLSPPWSKSMSTPPRAADRSGMSVHSPAVTRHGSICPRGPATRRELLAC